MWCDLNFETSAPSQTWFVLRESFDVNDGEDGDILHVPGAQTEHQNDHGNSNIVSNPDPYTCEEHVIQTANIIDQITRKWTMQTTLLHVDGLIKLNSLPVLCWLISINFLSPHKVLTCCHPQTPVNAASLPISKAWMVQHPPEGVAFEARRVAGGWTAMRVLCVDQPCNQLSESNAVHGGLHQSLCPQCKHVSSHNSTIWISEGTYSKEHRACLWKQVLF